MRKLSILLRLLGTGFVLLLCHCSSPLDRARDKAQAVLEGLPVLETTDQICVDKFDRLAKQGIGTHTALIAVYGTQYSYQHVADFYRDSLTEVGWTKYSHTNWDYPLYCSPEHEQVRLQLVQLTSSAAICADPGDESGNSDYPTLYALDIRVFPFDDIGCEAED